jgi:hypothetical protein
VALNKEQKALDNFSQTILLLENCTVACESAIVRMGEHAQVKALINTVENKVEITRFLELAEQHIRKLRLGHMPRYNLTVGWHDSNIRIGSDEFSQLLAEKQCCMPLESILS